MSLAAFDISLNSTMGALFIGLVLSAIFQGITTMQAIFYYTTYPKDALYLKLMVAILWALDMTSISIIAYGVYTYLVTDFLDPFALLHLNWSFATEPLVSGTIAFVVHVFLAHRIWRLTDWGAPIALFIVVASLLPYATVFYAAAKGLSSDGSWADVSADLRWTAITGITVSSGIDVIITVTICIQLYCSKSGISQSNRMVHLLTMYTVTTGLIPTLVCFGDMIGYFAAPHTLAYEVCQGLLAYVNTLMATLNSRRAVRGRGELSSLVTESIPGIAFRRPHIASELPSTTVASTADDVDAPVLNDVKLDRGNISEFSWGAVVDGHPLAMSE
ncbi:hypothetical protein FOMPIDRAFT_90843 [Fomitopsis schrenkii]|uniref:DUF6534 domain-containing protein n=1 Tax=Fomitopsis schrenkii TaxID=2126942 RepID=S8DUE3_FOMSC|nr:hypothetical protein FOMPIDRAFT_90843 [Fomitopsis schrenkii]